MASIQCRIQHYFHICYNPVEYRDICTDIVNAQRRCTRCGQLLFNVDIPSICTAVQSYRALSWCFLGTRRSHAVHSELAYQTKSCVNVSGCLPDSIKSIPKKSHKTKSGDHLNTGNWGLWTAENGSFACKSFLAAKPTTEHPNKIRSRTTLERESDIRNLVRRNNYKDGSVGPGQYTQHTTLWT